MRKTPAFWRRALPLVLFAALWLDLIRLLSGNWEAREQYAYGYFVPFFAAALLWRRWADRPLPTSDSHLPPRSQLHAPRSTLDPSLILSVIIFLLCLSLLPLRVIFEINADWPLIAWVYTTIVVILTLYAFHLADPNSEVRSQKSEVSSTSGVVAPSQLPSPNSHLPSSGFRFHPSSLLTPWLRHFFFPVAFILVALVWPYRIEKGLTQGLMQVVAGITVEILGWIDIPALQRGNLIEISTGVLGVDEACSGIRSFQSTLMAGLLMGEFYRLRLLPRVSLVAIGLALAFSFNIVRTFLLSYQAEKEGMGAVDKWHDPAGFTIAVACFLCLWAISALASKRFAAKPFQVSGFKSHPSEPSASDLRPLTSGNSLQVSGFRFPPSAPGFMVGVGIWSIFCLLTTELWYRPLAEANASAVHWSIAMPTNQPTFEAITLPPRTLELLACDKGHSGGWKEPDGTKWAAHFFRWKPGSMQSVISARGHRPEICLNAAGLERISGPELVYLKAGSIDLPIQKYEFKAGGEMIHVFFCLWEDGQEQQQGMRSIRQSDRLQWVLERRRHLGQQTFELILTGYQGLDQAQAAVAARLPDLIQRDRVDAPIQ